MKACAQCGKSFECNAGQGACWCVAMPVAENIPLSLTDCLCEACLKSYIPTPEATDGDYYYDEQDRWVFTAQYHRKRGYCCKNNCKHCPW